MPRRVAVGGYGYEAEAARYRPVAGGNGGVGMGQREREREEGRERGRESLLAGIVEGRTAEGRVAEWRRHVGVLG